MSHNLSEKPLLFAASHPLAQLALLLCVSTLLLTGCPPVEGCIPGESPATELGKGAIEYLDLDQGERSLDLVFGSQGGFHVDLALQGTGLDVGQDDTGRNAREDIEVTLEGRMGGTVIGRSVPFATFRCNNSANALQAWGLRLIMDEPPSVLNGQMIDISASLTDGSGDMVSAHADGVTIIGDF